MNFLPVHSFRFGHRSAFSLIELLIVIGVIGVLLSITIPALRSARSSAMRVKSLSNLRGIGMTLEHYAQASGGEHPFLPEGEPIHLSPPGSDDEPDFSFSPVWYISRYWPALMHDIAPWKDHYESWLSPGMLSQRNSGEPWSEQDGAAWDSGLLVSYRYSNSFIARPVVWSESSSTATDADIQRTRRSDVRHPSSKVVMMDVDLAYLPRPLSPPIRRPVLFSDLSASAVLESDATTPVQNPLHFEPPRFYHDTPNGIDGRDF